ncbi:MAG: hydrogenase maturation nickel metallochaperone HypA [Pseudobutyrivibrio sp.]|nr:hydrogenase maturation nickel metallochaperone HypA [Pseudobutyrivibrio sp.]
MHELAVTEYVYNLVRKQAEANKATKVRKILLEMGDQSDYVPEIIAEYLQVMGDDGLLDGVKVEAKYLPSKVLCRDCGAEFTRHEFDGTCPKCGSENLKLNRNTDFLVKSIEIE